MRAVVVRGVVGSVMVLLGGFVVASLPESSSLLSHRMLADLRLSSLGRVVALTVVLVGLGAICHAWLTLCRGVADGLLDLRHVRLAGGLWAAPLVLAPPLFSSDGWSYAAQGVMAEQGFSPYEYGPSVLTGPIEQAVDPLWRYTPAPYGPLPLWWGEGIAHLTSSPLALVIGHRLLALAGVALLAWAMPRLAGWTGANPALATGLVVASPLLLTSGVAGLHNDVLMAGLMASALALTERSWLAGAVVAGLAAAVKVPGGVVGIGVALASLPMAATMPERLRRLAAVALVAVATLVGLGSISGLGSGWVHALGVPGGITTWMSPTTMAGDGLDRLLLVPDGLFRTVFRDLGWAGMGLVAVHGALRTPTGDRRRAVQAVALAAGAMAILAPSVHLWYLLWPLPFVGALRLGRVATTAFIAVNALAGLFAPMDTSWGEEPAAIVVGSVLIATTLLVLVASRRGRHRVGRIVTATAAPVPVQA